MSMVLVMLAAVSLKAGPITTVNIFKPGGIVPIATGVQTLVWQDGSDISIGFTGVPGSTFSNLYQSTLAGFLDENSNALSAAAGLGLDFSDPTAYEFSIVASLAFTVSTTGPNLYDLVPGTGTISIFLDGPGVGSLGVKADAATGIGFDDGFEIFRAVPAGGGAFPNGAVVMDELSFLSSVVDTDVLDAAAPIADFHFIDTKRPTPALVPVGFHINGDSVLYPDYSPVRGDTIIDLTASGGQFSTVPEPSSFLLCGTSFFAFCLWRRGKRFPWRTSRHDRRRRVPC